MNYVKKLFSQLVEYLFPARKCVKPCAGVQPKPKEPKAVKSKKSKPMPSKKGGKKGCK
jgi:hypothetical protein